MNGKACFFVVAVMAALLLVPAQPVQAEPCNTCCELATGDCETYYECLAECPEGWVFGDDNQCAGYATFCRRPNGECWTINASCYDALKCKPCTMPTVKDGDAGAESGEQETSTTEKAPSSRKWVLLGVALLVLGGIPLAIHRRRG